MPKQVLFRLLFLLLLALAACSGDDSPTPDATQPVPTPTPAPTLDGTAQVDDGGQDFTIYTPGIQPLPRGLTLVRFSQDVLNGTAYFFAEVRNDSDQPLHGVDGAVLPLESRGYRLDRLPLTTAMADDIPPGQSVYMGTWFPVPDGYADMQVWIDGDWRGEPSSQGFYHLPATVDFQGEGGEGVPYVVRGTITNNTNREFFTMVIDVVLIGPDENLVGLSNGVPNPLGLVAPGATVSFEAPFYFIAVEPSQISDVIVSAAGYATLE